MNWFVYILECSDTSLYTGITNNLERRLREHNHSKSLGSKFVRFRRPVTIVFSEHALSRREASKREAEIKKMSRSQKKKLIKHAGIMQS